MFSWTQVGHVFLDAKALGQLGHRCAPERCTATPHCCGSFEVAFDRSEAPRIVGMLPKTAHFAPHLREDGELIQPFDDTDDDLLAMETDEDGLCLAAYRDDQSALRCSLHSAALEADFPPERCKPRCCWLWPVSILEADNRTYVSVSEDVYAFPCNHRRRGMQRSLHPSVAEILRGAFTDDVVQAVNAALAALPDPRLR